MRKLLLLLPLCVAAALCGCGGGGHSSSGGAGGAGSGAGRAAVSITVVWPPPVSRVVPNEANSIKVDIAQTDPSSNTVVYTNSATLNRPDPASAQPTTTTFKELRPDLDVHISAVAYVGQNATGAALADKLDNVTPAASLVKDGTTPVTVTLGTLATDVKLSGSLPQGGGYDSSSNVYYLRLDTQDPANPTKHTDTLQVNANVVDANGALLLTDSQIISKSYTSDDPSVATVDANGVVTPKKNGTAHIKAVYHMDATNDITSAGSVTVTVVSATLLVNQDTIDRGQSVTLTWTSFGADTVNTGLTNFPVQATQLNGNLSVSPRVDTTYFVVLEKNLANQQILRFGSSVAVKVNQPTITLPPINTVTVPIHGKVVLTASITGVTDPASQSVSWALTGPQGGPAPGGPAANLSGQAPTTVTFNAPQPPATVNGGSRPPTSLTYTVTATYAPDSTVPPVSTTVTVLSVNTNVNIK